MQIMFKTIAMIHFFIQNPRTRELGKDHSTNKCLTRSNPDSKLINIIIDQQIKINTEITIKNLMLLMLNINFDVYAHRLIFVIDMLIIR